MGGVEQRYVIISVFRGGKEATLQCEGDSGRGAAGHIRYTGVPKIKTYIPDEILDKHERDIEHDKL